MRYLLTSILALLFVVNSYGTDGPGSLGSILNPDGTIKKGIQGSFDPAGYRLTYAENGEPVFVRNTIMATGDERWLPVPREQSGAISAIATYGGKLYVGGSFTNLGGNPDADRLAMWDGTKWNTVGAALSNSVTALTVSGGLLYVGGSFTNAGGNANADYIATWNGTTWGALGTGLNGPVRAVLVNGTTVFAGGHFTGAGPNADANFVAMWNGTSWGPLTEFQAYGLSNAVFALAMDASGNLYAGGTFTNSGVNGDINKVAVWDGTIWYPMNTGLNGDVLDITVYNNKVYAGGNFTDAGGNASADYLSMWNGSNWVAVGSGVNASVSAFWVDSGVLYIGGSFTDAGGNTNADNIATWNGTTWGAFGSGLNSFVNVIYVNGANVYAGGNFTHAGTTDAGGDKIAMWDGAWHNLGTGSGLPDDVYAIMPNGSNTIIGGLFENAWGIPDADFIATWDNASLKALGPRTGDCCTGLITNAIAIIGSNIYIGGVFGDTWGPTNMDYLAMWNGSSWSALGTGPNGLVRSLAVRGAQLYVGGDFTLAGGVANTAHIAMWDGSWHALGSGLTGSVYAIATTATKVYAGGNFQNGNGNANIDGIGSWDGSTWSALGTGITGTVFSLVASSNDLYVGGAFSNLGGDSNADGIAKWNGSNWQGIGSGLNSTVYSIAFSGNNIYVGGIFTNAGGDANADNIAVWNGNNWGALGSGLNGAVRAIAVSSNTLLVGGDFTATGDNSVVAYHLAQRTEIFPSVSLQASTAVSAFEVKLNGTVNPSGLSTNYNFEYGTSNNNLSSSTSIQSTSGSSDVAVNATLTSSTPYTVYYYRLKAVNEEGTSYSDIQSYTFPSDIEVRQGSTTLLTGAEYNFGNVNYLASSSDVTFSVYNLGLANLTLSGSAGSYIVKGGTNAGDFVVTQSGITSPFTPGTNQTFTVKFSPTSGGTRTATLTITSNDPDEASYVINLKGTGVKLNQTITFNSLPVKTVGDAAFGLTATASSGLTVSYSSSNTSVATVSGSTVTIVGPGSATITASQAGNSNYNAATSVDQTLVVRATEPDFQPTSLTFNTITGNSLKGAFVAASGSPTGYIVLRMANSAPTDTPADGSTYTAGTSIIGESTVVGFGNSLTFTDAGLTSGVTYYYRIYSYNGTGVATNYRLTTPLEGNQSTIVVEPSFPATGLSFSALTSTSMQVSFTAPSGNPAGYLVLRRSLNPVTDTPVDGVTYSGTFGQSTVVHNGSETTFSSTGLLAETIYHYSVFVYNGSGVLINYLNSSPLQGSRTTLAEEPVAQPTSLTFPDVSASSISGSFTGTAGAAGHIVLVNTEDVTDLPNDGIPYAANTTIGTSKVVQSGGATTFNHTLLDAGTKYYYKIYSYNGSDASTNYATTSPLAAGKLTLPAAPVAQIVTGQTSNYFKATWSQVVSATSYLLDVSESEEFDTYVLEDEPTIEEFYDVEDLTPDKTYYFRVTAVNESGPSAESNSISVKTNSGPGGPSEITLSNLVANSSQISITASGGANDKVVTIYYKGILEGESAWTSEPLAGSGSTYSKSYSSADLDELGMEFYFEADDDQNEPVRFPENNNSFVYRTIAASEKQIPFASGFDGEVNSYQMFSVPYVLDNPAINGIFDINLEGESTIQWRLFHYEDGTSKEYPKNFLQLEIGKGYWFNTFNKDFVIKIGAAKVVERNQQSPYMLTLAPGWNQVGNPYPFNISWSSVVGSNEDVSELNFWSNGAYSSRDVFKPWEGAFVLNSNTSAVQIPIDVNAKTSSGRVAVPEFTGNIDDDVWKVEFQLTAGGLKHSGGFGMHPDARPSKDKFDKITLPHFSDYAVMDVHHSEFFVPDFATDIVPTTHTYDWPFDVRSNLDGETVEITWDNSTMLHSVSTLILVDYSSQSWVDMKTTNRFQATIRDGLSLHILYSKAGEISLDRNMIGTAWPNPFNKEVTIPVLVGNDHVVSVELFDMMGRRVRTLRKEFPKPGIHSLSWDGTDDTGSAISNGLILYRMSGSEGQVKRLVKQ